MKLLKFLTVAVVCALAPSAVAGDLRASSITWENQFGSLGPEPLTEGQTTYSLMARGFFRAPTNDMQLVREAWLKKHPKAKLIPVSSMSSSTKDPRSRLTYVWIIDGDENLNLELVRQGCFRPATQTIGDGKELEVSRKNYDLFVKKLMAAAEYARNHKLGLWGKPEEPDNPND